MPYLIREIEPSINLAPETLTFEMLPEFEGYLIAEVSGLKKGPSVE